MLTASEASDAATIPREILLLRREGGTETAAFEAITPESWDRVLGAWLPMLLETDDDHDWPWGDLLEDHRLSFPIEVERLAIVFEGEVQGIIATSLPKRSDPADWPNERPLWIEYLSVAPWNRRNRGDQRLFVGVGIVLLRHAVFRSLGAGREGRIELLSEPGAVAFYKGAGLQPQTELSDEETFFFGSPSWAQAFLRPSP